MAEAGGRCQNRMVTIYLHPSGQLDMIVTVSKDKSIILWKLNKDDKTDSASCRRLTGHSHSHFVEDIVLSSDGQFPMTHKH